MNIVENKIILRNKFLKDRIKKSDDVITEAHNKILPYARSLMSFHSTVAIFHSINGEIDLAPLIAYAQERTIKIFLPKVISKTEIVFCPYEIGDKLVKSSFGVDEPLSEPHEGMIDLFFVPGAAFGRDGSRLGYGMGYFDRYFDKHKDTVGQKMGVCYHNHLVESIPTEDHDIKMDGVLTEEGLLLVSQ